MDFVEDGICSKLASLVTSKINAIPTLTSTVYVGPVLNCILINPEFPSLNVIQNSFYVQHLVSLFGL